MSSDPEPVVVADVSNGLGIDVLETLVNRAYDRAKRWAGAVLILQSGLFVAGALAIFWPFLTLTYPWLAVPLVLLGAWISARASKYKSLAEGAKRQHEYVAGFGVKPSLRELANLRQSLQKQLSPEAGALLKQGITYASEEPHGPRRALENLSESAWFSKHLAAHCVHWVAATFIITLLIAISLLLWAVVEVSGTAGGATAAKSFAATFTFLISVGSIRSWVGYAKLERKADKIDGDATAMLGIADPSNFEVQRLLTEYQVSRASAPLIPTWIWKIHRDSMNEDWKLRCQKT
jgi:hypothetical protein